MSQGGVSNNFIVNKQYEQFEWLKMASPLLDALLVSAAHA